MKKLSYLIILVILTSCVNSPTKNDRNITLGDTITTASGLQYVFIKEGQGRKIEKGSLVKSYMDLYLNDADTIFWSTATSPDSIFQYIHGKTSLITGFTELSSYLHEGDEVIAILPYSIAYGENDRRGIPGKSTLIYDPLVVRYVSEPKEVLTDTMLSIINTKNTQSAIEFYEHILSSELKNSYHFELENMTDILAKLHRDSLYIETEVMANYFLSKTDDESLKENFAYFKLIVFEAQEKYQEAIALVKPLIKEENQQDFWWNKLKELEAK